jgi:isocitrate dehydrogenase
METKVLMYSEAARQVPAFSIMKQQKLMPTTKKSREICVVRGEGIGAEITDAVRDVIYSAGAQVDFHVVEISPHYMQAGNSAGISPLALQSLARCKVLLKAPSSRLQQDQADKRLDQALQEIFGLFASVQPNVAYFPFVAPRYANMRVAIIRDLGQDVEDGLAHRDTHAAPDLKCYSRPDLERLVRFAFDFARMNRRLNVSCFAKGPMTELPHSQFRRTFFKVAQDYPEIEHRLLSLETGTGRLVTHPEEFDVVILPKSCEKVFSSATGQMADSLALAGSARIGCDGTVFEAARARTRGYSKAANPSGLLQAAVMMLHHLGQPIVADRIHGALLRTIDDEVHTASDIHIDRPRAKSVPIKQFAKEVIARFGLQSRLITDRPFIVLHCAPMDFIRSESLADLKAFGLVANTQQ